MKEKKGRGKKEMKEKGKRELDLLSQIVVQRRLE